MRHKQKKVSVLDSKSTDNINPQHYKSGNIECIDTIKASMTHESFKGYLKGNIQKYIFRYEQKKGLEDLQKAEWYLTRLILECKKVAEVMVKYKICPVCDSFFECKTRQDQKFCSDACKAKNYRNNKELKNKRGKI
jgi:predicted nucleic acid-binding Zn ribbon protein